MTKESKYSTDGIPAAVGFADTLKLIRRHLLFILLVAVIPTLLAAYVLSLDEAPVSPYRPSELALSAF